MRCFLSDLFWIANGMYGMRFRLLQVFNPMFELMSSHDVCGGEKLRSLQYGLLHMFGQRGSLHWV